MAGDGDRLERRRWAIGLAALGLLAAGVAACGSSSPDGARPSDDAGTTDAAASLPEPVGEAVDLSEPGLHVLSAPPLERRAFEGSGTSTWAGDRFVVWGGQQAEDPSALGRQLGDGATLSLDDGRWSPMPPSPFPHGLYHPIAAWDGTEVIIIGTECDEELPADTDGSAPDCPKGPAAAAYEPTTGAWRQLPAPPIPIDDDWRQPVLRAGGEGVGADGRALFTSGWDPIVIGWDRRDESWTLHDPAFGEGTRTGACIDQVRSEVVVIATSPPGSARPSRARRLAVDAAAWSPVVDLSVPVEQPDDCADGALAAFGYGSGPDRSDVIDLETGEVLVSEVDEESPVTSRSLRLSGPWVLRTTYEYLAGTPEREFRQDVRLLVGDPEGWVPLEGITARAYVPDVGIIGVGFGDDSPFAFWRAPEDLIP
jgi:hypothetical protein